MFGFFIITKLFDISCISDHVQPISKLLSVVLAECGHFVVTGLCRNIHMVTWSVQEYSYGHLVCAGIFIWSPGLCRNIPAQFCVHPSLCRNIPAELEPFDLCACSCMRYLVGYLKPDLCKS